MGIATVDKGEGSTMAEIKGYTTVTEANKAYVNSNKILEEVVLRRCDDIRLNPNYDQRFVSIAVTHFQEGFMALNRAVMQPTRIKISEEDIIAIGDKTFVLLKPVAMDDC